MENNFLVKKSIGSPKQRDESNNTNNVYPNVMHWERHNVSSVIFPPIMYNLNLIMKHQTNQTE